MKLREPDVISISLSEYARPLEVSQFKLALRPDINMAPAPNKDAIVLVRLPRSMIAQKNIILGFRSLPWNQNGNPYRAVGHSSSLAAFL